MKQLRMVMAVLAALVAMGSRAQNDNSDGLKSTE